MSSTSNFFFLRQVPLTGVSATQIIVILYQMRR
ncbi:MAG: hypothetical protein H5U12_14815 [Hoeflea sp.]|nr:hypothetical protein [Hoeflea sp.]